MAVPDLTGRVAVVTGAASGIGLALTHAFLREGARVVMADIEEAALWAQAQTLKEQGAPVMGVVCDVSDYGSVQSLAEQTCERWGGVHVLCNNAGVAPAGPMLETTPQEWNWVFGVNVFGVVNGILAFAPRMLEAGEGHIVNTASAVGLMGSRGVGMYSASKHAVVGLSESLYWQLEPTPVGVSVFCPGMAQTRIFESERNAPIELPVTERRQATTTILRKEMAEQGVRPSHLAGAVIDAVRTGTFWIFTHDTTWRRAAIRLRDIEAGRNPTPWWES